MAEALTGNRTILWCAPRSGSTALAKCLTAVEGMEVWFQPFCFAFLFKKDAVRYFDMKLPDEEYEEHEEIYQTAARLLKDVAPYPFRPDHLSYASIKRKLEKSLSQRVFVKDIGRAFTKDQLHLIPRGYQHTFLIRHPFQVLSSFRRATITHLANLGRLNVGIDDFDLETDVYNITSGLAFKELYDIWKYVQETSDPNPVVIDGDDLMTKPAEVLPKYCRKVGIPYEDSLLSWSGSVDATRTWKTPFAPGISLHTISPSFFDRAVTSNRFYPPSPLPTEDQLTPDVIRCSEKVIGYYEEMYMTRV